MKHRKLQQTISFFTLLAVFFATAIAVKALPGVTDESYGTTGFYFDNQPNTTGDRPEGTFFTDGELTADGKLTSVGFFTYFVENLGYVQDLYVQRLLPDGTRDPSLNEGVNHPGNGNGLGSVRFSNVLPVGSQFAARAVKIQQDNKIVVAGICNIITNFGMPGTKQSGYGMCAARLLPSGALDASFGGNNFIVQHSPTDASQNFVFTMPSGMTFVHYPGSVESGYAGIFNSCNAGALDVALHSDGRIALAGFGATREFAANGGFLGYNHLALVVNLTPSGALHSFLNVPGDQTFEVARRTRGRTFYQIETQSDGSYVAAGYNLHLTPDGFVDGARWMVTNGTLPWYSELYSNRGYATSVKFTRGNKILVAGKTRDGDVDTSAMVRFNSDLSVDTTFGSGGKVTYCRGEVPCQILPFTILPKLAGVQNDGKILALTGGSFDPYNHPFDGVGGDRLVRFNPDGSFDRSFGNAIFDNPSVITSYGYSVLHRTTQLGFPQSIVSSEYAALQTDGKILAGGAYVTDGNQTGRAGVTRRQNTFRSSGILSDFDNDGRGDVSVWRPSDGVWHNLNSFNNSYTPVQWGISTDKIAPADYDGDGKTDRAVFRDGIWYIFRSSDNQFSILQWGIAGDLPRPGDYNGDGLADIAVWRPSNGTWYVIYSNPIQPGNVTTAIVQFGASGDVPLIADFDGDGKTDYAVFRSGVWYILRSSDAGIGIVQFGLAGDVPVVGDYDGDSKSDLAVFRNGTWYAQKSSDGSYIILNWGLNGDRAVPADYDNDGRNDFAIYRNGIWWILRSSDGGHSVVSFGLAGDLPVPAAYLQ